MCFHMQILLNLESTWGEIYQSVYPFIYLLAHTHQDVDHIYKNGNCSLDLGLEIKSEPKLNKLFKNNYRSLHT